MARPTPNNPNGAQKSPARTKEAVAKLEQAFAIGATVEEACFYADISEATYYRWIKDDKELGERLGRLENKPILAARQALVNAITGKKDKAGNYIVEPDPVLALKYLERKRKAEFSTRQENENTNKHTGDLVVRVLLPDEAEA